MIWFWQLYDLSLYNVTLCAFYYGLIVIIVTDLKTHVIPDLILLFLSLFAATLIILFNNQFFIATAVLFPLLFLLIKYTFLRLRNKDVIGWGDIKLMLVLGLFIPPDQIPDFLFIAGCIGLFQGLFWRYILKKTHFPFSPALITSFIITNSSF